MTPSTASPITALSTPGTPVALLRPGLHEGARLVSYLSYAYPELLAQDLSWLASSRPEDSTRPSA
jgi:hypothetical protein